MTNQTSIEAAIAAAQAAAAAVPALAHQALGGTPAAYTQPAPVSAGAALGVDDLLQGSLKVKTWLEVIHFGMRIGNDIKLHTKFDVSIPLDEVGYCMSIRHGNPAKYEKTYDRMTNVRGGSWAETVMRVQKVDPKASEFRSADIPFIFNEDVLASDGKTVLIEAGDRVGHSLAVTGWKPFQEFINVLKKLGIDHRNGLVRLDLGFEPKKNDSGEWGLLTFKNPRTA